MCLCITVPAAPPPPAAPVAPPPPSITALHNQVL